MKKISLLIGAAFFSLCSFGLSSDSSFVTRKHEFGVHLGATTGMGLSYRFWPKKLGVQFTVLPIKMKSEYLIDVGITALYSFYDSKNIRFFCYLGNNLIAQRYNVEVGGYYTKNTDEKGNVQYSQQELKTEPHEFKMYNAGFGPGFGFGNRVRFNVMAGYACYDILHQQNFLPTGEIGLYFRI